MSNDRKKFVFYFFRPGTKKKKKVAHQLGLWVRLLETWHEKWNWWELKERIKKYKAPLWRIPGPSCVLQGEMKWEIGARTTDDGAVSGGALISCFFLSFFFILIGGGFVFEDQAFNSDRGNTAACSRAWGEIYTRLFLTRRWSHVTRVDLKLKSLRNKQPTSPCFNQATKQNKTIETLF